MEEEERLSFSDLHAVDCDSVNRDIKFFQVLHLQLFLLFSQFCFLFFFLFCFLLPHVIALYTVCSVFLGA